jgi:pyruvate dehydrogenase E1 component beta subunit
VTSSTFRDAIDAAIKEIMRADGSVVLIGGSDPELAAEFGQRVVNVPPGENIVASAALGLAMTGAKPIVRIAGSYLLRYADAIGNEIALADTVTNGQYDSSVIIVSDIGYAPNLGPQMSQSYEALFCQFPGLAVVYPSNPSDAAALLRAAVDYNRPVLFLENKRCLAEYGEMHAEDVRIGKSKLVRLGRDLTIVSYGPMVTTCLKAAQLAADSGILCEIVDLRTISPLDIEPVIASIKKTGKLIVVHESRRMCGLGAEVSAEIAESDALFYLDSKILRVCSRDVPIPYAKNEYQKAVPNEEDILKAIIQLSAVD